MRVLYRIGEIVKRADTGRQVRILERIPNGLQVLYRAEDVETEVQNMYRPEQLREI